MPQRRSGAASAVLFLAAAASISVASPACAITQTVIVRDGSGALLPGATVYALAFTDHGPDAAYSRLAVTLAGGSVTFTVASGHGLELFADKQGFRPSLRDQMFSPTHIHVEPLTGQSLPDQTIRLSSQGVSGVGAIVEQVSGASLNSLLFGNVHHIHSDDQTGFGACATDGSGNCSLAVANLPAAPGGTYDASVYDPVLNKAVGGPVAQALVENGVLNVPEDFTQALAPPGGGQPNQSGNGTLSVDGVVIDTTPAETPIPFVGISFEYAQGAIPGNIWTNADQNGRFQLYGLAAGATYYARVYFGCNQTGCFDGTVSTHTTFSSPPGPNDFVYGGGTVVRKIRLRRVAGGNGSLPVQVRDQDGRPMYRAMVNVFPDFSGWDTDGNGTCNPFNPPHPGLANGNKEATTGYALITGLPSGNYIVNVMAPFAPQGAMFNAGADGLFRWEGHCDPNANPVFSDDLRVVVDTTSVPGVKVFDSRGVDLNRSSVTVVVPSHANTSGVVRGVLHFPTAADLTNDPISVQLFGNCDGHGCNGGFGVVNGVGANQAYSVNVSSGFIYNLDLQSGNWGRVVREGGSGQVDLTKSTFAIVNMEFAPAGTLRARVIKPDGSLFRPSRTADFSDAELEVHAINAASWGHGHTSDNGDIVVGGLLPGHYQGRIRAHGAFPYANPSPLPTFDVAVGAETALDIQVVNGVQMLPALATAGLPRLDFRPRQPGDPSSIESWQVRSLPQGTVFRGELLTGLLNDDGDGDESFQYFPPNAASPGGPCFPPGAWPGGFCPRLMPAPTVRDFYLFRRCNFTPGNPACQQMYFSILHSTRNVVLSQDRAQPTLINGATVPAFVLDMTPAGASLAQAALAGTVTAARMVTAEQFANLGGNFDNFMKYIPVVALYDGAGALVGAGLVTPPASALTPQVLGPIELAVRTGDFGLFQQIFSRLTFGYSIRGLKPGAALAAVVTTQNYPPFQARVTLGADRSTTTLNVDLDSAVGSGAALSGVVRSTAGAALAGASLTLQGESFGKKTLLTDASGAYSVTGLPRGAYQITASASGYAPAVKRFPISDADAVTEDIALSLAGGSITGTVYAQKMPFTKTQPGAEILAYDDTQNGLHPADELYLYKVHTSSAGQYRLDGLVPGDVYKVFLRVPGKYVLSQSTAAIAGTVGGIDFVMLPKPLEIEVFGRPNPPFFEFTVNNPKDFESGEAWYHDASSAFDVATATAVTRTTKLPNQKLLLQVPLADLSAGRTYILRIRAVSSSGQVVLKDLPFGLATHGHADQDMDGTILGDSEEDDAGRRGNEAALDETGGNPSSVSVPPGSMIAVSTGAIPSLQFSNAGVDASTVAALVGAMDPAAFAGDIYQLTLSSVNFTQRGFDVCLAYDKTRSDLQDLALYAYDAAAGSWVPVSGIQTVDPIQGTVCARVRGLSNISGQGLHASSMQARFDGRQHVVNALSASTDSGAFAVLKPSVVNVPGDAYSGTAFKVFNFPNPFKLEDKTLTLANGGPTASLATPGTIIKYELPAASGGSITVRIYDTSGLLVRTLEAGSQAGGKYHYLVWDGRNKDGSKVAKGVYYGILHAPGVNGKDGTFKMVVR